MINKLRYFLLATLGIFTILSLSKTLLGYKDKFVYYDEYKKKYLAEKKHNSKLKGDIVKAQDQQEVEENIRNRLNRTKSHEVIVIIPQKKPTPTIEPTPSLSPSQEWMKLFGLQ